MDLLVLDTNFHAVGLIDSYESVIWTDRFRECGDFELYHSVTEKLLEIMKLDYYLITKESECAMIIENINITTDLEDGDKISVTGRSLKSILGRRVIWGQLSVSGSLQDGVRTLLEHCIINPSKPERKIENFIFKESTDPAITELTLEAQYLGDNLLDVIQTICSDNKIGFKVTFDEYYNFVFELCAGTDRSYSQFVNPYVVFSPNFENLISSDYTESKTNYKNVVLVGGEGEGAAKKYAAFGNVSGLDRRETYTDEGSASSDAGGNYESQLEQKGRDTLAESKEVTSFEGEIDTAKYVYNKDYYIGDIVQLADRYGHESRVEIVEIIMSCDESGFTMYPTFTTLS